MTKTYNTSSILIIIFSGSVWSKLQLVSEIYVPYSINSSVLIQYIIVKCDFYQWIIDTHQYIICVILYFVYKIIKNCV